MSSQRLSAPEAARYCGISPSTMAKLRVRGGSPIYAKIGRRVVYDTADLDAWISAHRRANTSQPATTMAGGTS